MALISLKNNKKDKNNLIVNEHIKDDPSGKGLVKRSSRCEEPLTNRNGLINGLTIAEQDPNMARGNKSAKTKDKKRVGASAALLKK